MIILDLTGVEPKEYQFPENSIEGQPTATLTIQPYPNSMSSSIIRASVGGGTEFVMTGGENKRIFTYCLVSAKGFCDRNGKEIPMTEENKSRIFDYEHIFQTGLPAFVLEKSRALATAKAEQEKN